MRHYAPITSVPKRSLLASRRFQLAFLTAQSALIPYVLRLTLGMPYWEPAVVNALWFNAIAVVIAFWLRLSIEPYPGIRQSYVIFPAATAGHGVVLFILLMTRLPYDRLGLLLGFVLHVVLAYMFWFLVQRKTRLRIGLTPGGGVSHLLQIPTVDWVRLKAPSMEQIGQLDAIVVDFTAKLTDEWEMLLADAAVAGHMVYHAKQLSESLTGKVQLEHISENSFGMLIPGRGYFHLKSLLDWSAAVLIAPLAFPVLLILSILIRLTDGGPALFRQKRHGRAGAVFTVYKFRTMIVEDEEAQLAPEKLATLHDDPRITRLGAFLRRTRIDELPQIINILRGEMSWIGPRPEPADLLPSFVSEIPFYRYRFVVKPGITGWAQVNQGYVSGKHGIAKKLQYDFYYIKHFSPWLDVLISFKTLKTMFTGSGAR